MLAHHPISQRGIGGLPYSSVDKNVNHSPANVLSRTSPFGQPFLSPALSLLECEYFRGIFGRGRDKDRKGWRKKEKEREKEKVAARMSDDRRLADLDFSHFSSSHSPNGYPIDAG